VSYGALRAEGYWNKQIFPGRMTIMISYRDVHISSKEPHDKSGVVHLQGVRQTVH
jgi:hypothetical protein